MAPTHGKEGRMADARAGLPICKGQALWPLTPYTTIPHLEIRSSRMHVACLLLVPTPATQVSRVRRYSS